MSDTKGLIAGLAAITLWSSTGAALVLWSHSIPSFQLATIIMIGAYLLMSLYWKARGEKILSKFQMDWKSYTVGVCGIAGYSLCWMVGFKFAPALEANTLNYLWPALLLVLMARAQKTAITPVQWIGIALSFTGCVFVLLRGASVSFNLEHLGGHLAALAGAVIWAVYSTLTKYVTFPSDRVAVFCLIGGLCCAVLHLLFETTVIPTGTVWIALLLLAFSRVSYVLWDVAMKSEHSPLIASLAYFIPLLSMLALCVTGAAVITHNALIGAPLVVIGCLLINAANIRKALSRERA